MNAPATCPQCQKPVPEHAGAAACPHCGAVEAPRHRKFRSGFFVAGSPMRAPTLTVPVRTPEPVVAPVADDRWDLPDARGARVSEPPGERISLVPPPAAAPTDRPPSVEAEGVGDDPLSWGPEAPPASTPPSGRPRSEPAMQPADDAAASPIAPLSTSPVARPKAAFASARPDPERTAAAAGEEAFPLLRATNPDVVPAPAAVVDAPSSAPVATPVATPVADDMRPSQATYLPLRAPPKLRPMSITTAAWWCISAAVLSLAAVVAVHGAMAATAVRGAAAVAAFAMLARYRGLATRARVLCAIAIPALLRETREVPTLAGNVGVALAAALLLLPAGAWLRLGSARARRPLLVLGMAATFGALLLPGGVRGPWAIATVPSLLLAVLALVFRARWIAVWLTVAQAAWALGSGLEPGGGLAEASSGLALASLTLLGGRALATAIEADDR